jgi:two-component system, cell cycle response regulator
MSNSKKTGDRSTVEDISVRRMQQMTEENRALRQYVAEVMKRLRENERLFSRLFELESQVLAATDPEDLCFVLLRGLRSGFELDLVRFWFDRSSFMGGRKLDALSEHDLIWLESGEIAQVGLDKNRVRLIRVTPKKSFEWLQARDSHIGSIALLTLGHLERPFGVLGIGSDSADRFRPDQATDFLQHLAQVIGLSLENAVARERLARHAVTDSLTGSRNRRFLQPHSHQPLSQWFGEGAPVACLYLDVDDLKVLNDRHGHEKGDELLERVCSTTRGFVRAQDPMIRMGGDEFVLLLPGCGGKKAVEIAGRIVEACSQIVMGEEHAGVSMGVAVSLPEQDLQVRELIDLADQAMYVAKALGGSRFEVANPDAD